MAVIRNYLALTSMLVMCSTALLSKSAPHCAEIGMDCTKTVSTHCCGELICHMRDNTHGTCKKCLPSGASCVNSVHCCTNSCLIKCK
ncbi:hypothetical protein EG68_08560 [Paragonimus skrjabini miyazakii]|uniref:UPF0506 domain-containing protein n=1 Tax=Paragonimus skrjabini miyazakii TaxID=59628 RepID=A0A8S9YNW6_9TREM|nr:hypothetical protein EG68_08560 [Paragonimus skrjabini miyazakii]